ncbi:tRNA pseudouridine(55) synthase [Trifolium repens]|nr:tRNA pseudouridine(55) synthase [Trifolium repens]
MKRFVGVGLFEVGTIVDEEIDEGGGETSLNSERSSENLDCCFLLFATKVLQRTPIRVLHRRSPLEREKIIHWMKIEAIAGSSQYFLLHLCTQVWFYIPSCVDENSQ